MTIRILLHDGASLEGAVTVQRTTNLCRTTYYLLSSGEIEQATRTPSLHQVDLKAFNAIHDQPLALDP